MATTRLARSSWHALAVFAALISSKAFVDYFDIRSRERADLRAADLVPVALVAEPPGERRTGRIFLIGSLCIVNRMDLALLVGPALALEMARSGVRVGAGRR